MNHDRTSTELSWVAAAAAMTECAAPLVRSSLPVMAEQAATRDKPAICMVPA